MVYLRVVGNIYFDKIRQILSATNNDTELFEAIVNAPFHNKIRATHLDLGIVVFLLVNKKTKMIDRIALSDTEAATGAVKMTEIPFHQIKIPLGYTENAIAEAIKTGEPQFVSDWKYLFIPALDPKAARFNQAGAGIEFSAVFPFKAHGGGALIFSYFQVWQNLGEKHQKFMRNYIKIIEQELRK